MKLFRLFSSILTHPHPLDDRDDNIQDQYQIFTPYLRDSTTEIGHPVFLAACYQALTLLKAQHVSISTASSPKTIRDLLKASGVRYRVVEPESDFSKYDFGVMIGIRDDTDIRSVDVLTKFEEKLLVHRVRESEKNSQFSVISKSAMSEDQAPSDYSYFLEVYAPLPFSITTISAFLKFIFSEFKADVAFVLFFSLMGSSLQLLFPSLTVYVTSHVVSLGSINLAIQIGFLAILLALVSVSSLFVQSLFVTKLETESDKRAQTAVWDRLLKLELSELSKYSNADLMMRASAISQVRTLLSSSNIASLVSLVTSFAFVYLMYTYVPSALIALLPLIGLYVIVAIRNSLTGGKLLTQSLNSAAELSNYTLQLLTCFPEIKVLRIYEDWERKFVDKLKISQSLSYRSRKRDNSTEILSKSFQSLAFCISLVVILHSLQSEDLDVEQYVFKILGYTSALTLFSSNLSSGTTTIADSVVQVLAYWKRAEPLVFAPIEPGYSPSNTDINYTGLVEFQNVSFAYNSESSPVLADLTFKSQPGSSTLLKIPPGHGSSTIFKLALGLYPALSGHILYDGHHIESLNITSLRHNISLSPQTPYVPMGPLGDLFEGPLASTDSGLNSFLEAFHLVELVDSLRMGLDTPIPPSASCFSSAQKQIFSLANSVARQPKLLFLDNCMSSIPFDIKRSILAYLLSNKITVFAVDPDLESESLYTSVIQIR